MPDDPKTPAAAKPSLTLQPAREMTFEDFNKLCKHLTGRDPDPAEEADCRQMWAEWEAECRAEKAAAATTDDGEAESEDDDAEAVQP
jgi:hypothetical protein